ncbi:hypothetical protein [Exiguobacterium sp. s50]|uniref:hypothetical protein n=1 Tax=Exiguobacterium sp. s50 TaxID=2751234 RepID=UPI001BED3737|nr:hypothetical protein [Exiguobacterium sp. s50]
MSEQLKQEKNLLEMQLAEQIEENKRLQREYRIRGQQYQRLLHRYAELLYTVEWISKEAAKADSRYQQMNRKYKQVQRKYQGLTQSKAGKILLKVRAVRSRIGKIVNSK